MDKIHPLALARQLLQVLSPGWNSDYGQLQRWQRPTPDAPWQRFAEPLPVTLGRHGLAWGLGLHPDPGSMVLHKTEGDGRSPAGVFAITALFGTEATRAALPSPCGLPFLTTHAQLKCVDDPQSPHYNCLVDQRDFTKDDWQSAEDMERSDHRYLAGAVVAHNQPQPRPGAGSCIFLHVWASPTSPTAGCTAMALEAMLDIATWLQQEAQPVLVQLPQDEYTRLQSPWQLP